MAQDGDGNEQVFRPDLGGDLVASGGGTGGTCWRMGQSVHCDNACRAGRPAARRTTARASSAIRWARPAIATDTDQCRPLADHAVLWLDVMGVGEHRRGISPSRPQWPESLGNLSRHHDLRQCADEAEAARMVHAAFDAGVNFFDTADAYVNGVSEAMLGKALKAGGRTPSSPPRCSIRWGAAQRLGHVAPAHQAGRRGQPAPPAEPTTSTSITSITSTSRRRSRRCCAPSTISCARARSSTRAARTSRRGA